MTFLSADFLEFYYYYVLLHVHTYFTLTTNLYSNSHVSLVRNRLLQMRYLPFSYMQVYVGTSGWSALLFIIELVFCGNSMRNSQVMYDVIICNRLQPEKQNNSKRGVTRALLRSSLQKLLSAVKMTSVNPLVKLTLTTSTDYSGRYLIPTVWRSCRSLRMPGEGCTVRN